MKAVSISGYSAGNVSTAGMEGINFRYLQKPVGKDNLLRTVQEILVA